MELVRSGPLRGAADGPQTWRSFVESRAELVAVRSETLSELGALVRDDGDRRRLGQVSTIGAQEGIHVIPGVGHSFVRRVDRVEDQNDMNRFLAFADGFKRRNRWRCFVVEERDIS